MKRLTAIMIATATMTVAVFSAQAGSFTYMAQNVPMRWDDTETNIPDDSTISFGTDQDITVSYNAATDFISVGGSVAVESVIIGSGETTQTGCIRYAGGKVYVFNGTDWDSVTVADSPTPTPTPTPNGYKTPTPSPTPSATPSTTPTPTPSVTPTPTPSTTPSTTPTPSVTPTAVPTASVTPTPSTTPTAVPTASPTPTAAIPSPTPSP